MKKLLPITVLAGAAAAVGVIQLTESNAPSVTKSSIQDVSDATTPITTKRNRPAALSTLDQTAGIQAPEQTKSVDRAVAEVSKSSSNSGLRTMPLPQAQQPANRSTAAVASNSASVSSADQATAKNGTVRNNNSIASNQTTQNFNNSVVNSGFGGSNTLSAPTNTGASSVLTDSGASVLSVDSSEAEPIGSNPEVASNSAPESSSSPSPTTANATSSGDSPSLVASSANMTPEGATFSHPVGYVTLGNPDGNAATPDVPANTDVTVSIPFARETELTRSVIGITGSVVTFGGPTVTAQAFVDANAPYQLTVTSGAQEGLVALISANGTNTFTIGSVIAGDLSAVETDGTAKFDVSKAWTLASYFPNDLSPGTSVLLFTGTNSGINVAADLGYVWSGTSWRGNLGASGDGNNTLLFPGESFILRTQSLPVDSLVVSGSVPMSTSKTVVRKLNSTQAQDTRLSFNIPVDQPIENLQGMEPGDRLLAFSNANGGINKAATEILVYTSTGWTGIGGVSGPQNGIYKIKAGVGYVVRRDAGRGVGDITYSLPIDYDNSL